MIIGGAIAAVIVFIIVYNVFIAKKSGTAVLSLPGIGEEKETLPPVPGLHTKFSVFDKIDRLKLNSFVPLPIQADPKGKINPFEPFEGFECVPSCSIPEGPKPSKSTSTNISQGSK